MIVRHLIVRYEIYDYETRGDDFLSSRLREKVRSYVNQSEMHLQFSLASMSLNVRLEYHSGKKVT